MFYHRRLAIKVCWRLSGTRTCPQGRRRLQSFCPKTGVLPLKYMCIFFLRFSFSFSSSFRIVFLSKKTNVFFKKCFFRFCFFFLSFAFFRSRKVVVEIVCRVFFQANCFVVNFLCHQKEVFKGRQLVGVYCFFFTFFCFFSAVTHV
jgi:hypothetical protein